LGIARENSSSTNEDKSVLFRDEGKGKMCIPSSRKKGEHS